jgi:hypothetical protein
MLLSFYISLGIFRTLRVSQYCPCIASQVRLIDYGGINTNDMRYSRQVASSTAEVDS